MVFNSLLAAATALSVLTPAVSAFNSQAKTNVVTYYGQAPYQDRLRHFCQETSLDIINLGFVNVFPDQGLNGWPESNFGNQCGGETFTIDGNDTNLLSNCHQLWEDIPVCQALGKKVFLSLGGAVPDNQKIKDEDSAKAFANFLWLAFGPPTEQWAAIGGPRPFRNVSVDGFDFDIEHNGGFGYATMVNTLRERFADYPDQRFYISGAPQCPTPDVQLSDAISNAPFDFIWVQFYNNPACSADKFGHGNGFNYDKWVEIIKKSANPSAKLYVGLAGNPFSGTGYITPAQVRPLVSHYMEKYPETFGGIMAWDASSSDWNVIHGRPYTDHMKEILMECAPAPPTPTPTPTPSTTSHPVTTTTSSTTPSGASTTLTSTTPSSSAKPTDSETSSSIALTTTRSSSAKPTGSETPTGSSTALTTTPSSSAKPTGSETPTGSSTALTTTPSSSAKPTGSETPSSSSKPHTTSKPVIPTTSSTFTVGRSSTTPAPSGKPSSVPTGSGSPSTITPGTPSGSPSVAPTGTSSAPETVTTVIVTEYTSICPTGFTTITTTYTTTYCPGTVSATPTVTNAPSGPSGAVPQTTSESLPDGWTTTVTVCTQCGPTPTTVTLTLPCETTGTSDAGSQPSGSSPAGGSEGSPSQGGSGAQPTTTPIIIPVPSSSSRPSSTPGVGGIRPSASPSKTLSFQPSASASRVPTAPSTTNGVDVPLSTGGATRLGLANGMVLCLTLLLSAFIMV